MKTKVKKNETNKHINELQIPIFEYSIILDVKERNRNKSSKYYEHWFSEHCEL